MADYGYLSCIWNILVPSPWTYAILIPILLLWLTRFLWQQYFESQLDPSIQHPLPPGSMGWPIIGETIQTLYNLQYGGGKTKFAEGSMIHKTHLFGQPTVRIRGTDYIRQVLQQEHKLVTAQWPRTVTELNGPGCMASLKDDAQRERRRIILSAFKHDALSQFVTPIRRTMQTTFSRWLEAEQIVTYPEIKRLTFEVTSQTIVGFKYNSIEDQQDLIQMFDEFINGLFTLRINLPGFAFYRAKKARQKLDVRIEECMNQMEASPSCHVTTVLASLLANIGDDAVSRDELRDEVINLMFAGHDTTASAITMVIMYLAKYPDVVTKLRQELDANNVNSDVTMTYDLLNRLSYVDAVMREVFVQKPPIGSGFRLVLKSFELGGYQVPKGWKISYSIKDNNRLVYSNGFNPDRWLKTNSEGLKNEPDNSPEVLEPEKSSADNINRDVVYFGVGSRSCVGKEFAKLVVRLFIVEFVSSCDVTLINDDVILTYFPMPKPRDGMPVKVTKRQ